MLAGPFDLASLFRIAKSGAGDPGRGRAGDCDGDRRHPADQAPLPRGGGMGGAIRNGGGSTITVENSTLTDNQAIGGNGGRAASTAKRL